MRLNFRLPGPEWLPYWPVACAGQVLQPRNTLHTHYIQVNNDTDCSVLKRVPQVTKRSARQLLATRTLLMLPKSA